MTNRIDETLQRKAINSFSNFLSAILAIKEHI